MKGTERKLAKSVFGYFELSTSFDSANSVELLGNMRIGGGEFLME